MRRPDAGGGCSRSRPQAEKPRSWLSHPLGIRPSSATLALLQLFFADLESTAATLAIAEEQLALHQRQLAGYEADQRFEDRLDGGQGISRTLQHWRGVTLKIGLLYERAAVDSGARSQRRVPPMEANATEVAAATG